MYTHLLTVIIQPPGVLGSNKSKKEDNKISTINPHHNSANPSQSTRSLQTKNFPHHRPYTNGPSWSKKKKTKQLIKIKLITCSKQDRNLAIFM